MGRRGTKGFRELSPAGQARADLALRLASLCAPLIGAFVRLPYVLQQGFPLGDGGLFYLMTQELRRAHYALPVYTAYNRAGIPFAYPPLGFYLAGALADLGRWPLLEVFRFLPLVLNLLTIAAFYPLSRAMLRLRPAAAYAVLAFALLPYGFFWQIMGGGVTRALGFLFAVLTLWQGYLLYSRRQAWRVWPTMLLASGAVLSHPSMGLFVAYSLALLFVAYGRSRWGAIHSLLVAAGTAALTAPWWATVMARHGLAPLLSAAGTGGYRPAGLARLVYLVLTDEPYFALLEGLALLGVLASLRDRRFFLPAWLAMMFIIDPRDGATTATLPLAMLGGIGIVEVVLPSLSRDERPDASGVPRNVLSVIVLVLILQYAALTARSGHRAWLPSLNPDVRAAMDWIARETPPDSTFVVVSPGEQLDATSEWFPVLADRVSVTNFQGYEWLDGGSFRRQRVRDQQAQDCAGQDANCLEACGEGLDPPFTHVYVAKSQGAVRDTTAALRGSLDHDLRYRPIYDGPAARIYRRVEGLSGG